MPHTTHFCYDYEGKLDQNENTTIRGSIRGCIGAELDIGIDD